MLYLYHKLFQERIFFKWFCLQPICNKKGYRKEMWVLGQASYLWDGKETEPKTSSWERAPRCDTQTHLVPWEKGWEGVGKQEEERVTSNKQQVRWQHVLQFFPTWRQRSNWIFILKLELCNFLKSQVHVALVQFCIAAGPYPKSLLANA